MHGKVRVLGSSALGLLLAVSALAGVSAACGADTDAEDGEDASTLEGGPRRDGASDSGALLEDGGTAPETETFCERMRAYTLDCGQTLECGAQDFDRWCDANTNAVDSDAYRRGYLQCATSDKCTSADRRDCMYRSYATAAQSTAQQALVQAYCQTCEPSNVQACALRVVQYDPAKGPVSADVAFIAAWELGDTLADQVRTECTGTKIDAGASPASCLEAFDLCAGGYYVDALVSCP